jgi:hypothetical protein
MRLDVVVFIVLAGTLLICGVFSLQDGADPWRVVGGLVAAVASITGLLALVRRARAGDMPPNPARQLADLSEDTGYLLAIYDLRRIINDGRGCYTGEVLEAKLQRAYDIRYGVEHKEGDHG